MPELSRLEPSSSTDLVSSSSSDCFSCPSLSSSNTLSSEDFTELETDQDVISPLCSPSLESTYAYDLAHVLSCSMDRISLNEADTTTPRPLRCDRKGYFHGRVKLEDDGYEGGSEAGCLPNLLVKKRLYNLRNRKSSILSRTSRVEQPDDEYTSDNFKIMDMARGNSPSRPQDASVRRRSSPMDTYCPETEVNPIRKTVLSNTKEATRDVGLGRGHPIIRNEQLMQQKGFSTKSERPLPQNLVPDSPYIRSDDHGPELQKAPAKVSLKPVDAALEFMDLPSPIDELPPSILFERNTANLEGDVQILQAGSIGPRASVSIVGLGIDIPDRSVPASRSSHFAAKNTILS